MDDAPAQPDNLHARYDAHLAREGWCDDAVQRATLDRLESLREALMARHLARERRRWWRPSPDRPAPQGLYLWGGVGRGKTFLMDLFHAALPPVSAKRSHFHRFMYDVHSALKSLDNREDPLADVADGIAAEADVLCFDEFFVSDIADAMILGRLLQHLTARGVVLVATSNAPPAELYRDGLQRSRFLPAIAHLETHCDVVQVDGGVDYRLRVLERAACYLTPDDDDAGRALHDAFTALTDQATPEPDTIQIAGRPLPLRAKAAGVGWFDFDVLCRGPRSQNDYIELARRLHSVLLSGVPQMDGSDDNAARRFIALVDEFYDRRVNFIVAAAVAVDALYVGQRLEFEFERTRSRLTEMQTAAYHASPHRP